VLRFYAVPGVPGAASHPAWAGHHGWGPV